LNKRLFLLFLLLFLHLLAIAQQIGKPFVQNYPAKLYKAAIQNWAIVQDKRGVMYFANDLGVLEYDSRAWRLIPTANNSAVRSLSVDDNGTVWVGGSGDFGYLAPDSVGFLHYHSLKHLLKDQEYKFEDVWTCHAGIDGIYFHTDNFIFRYSPQKDQIKAWKAYSDSFFFLTFYVNDKLFVHDLKYGLHRLTEEKIAPLPLSENFKDERIYTMLPLNSHQILIGTRKRGLFVYETLINPKEAIQKFENEANDFLINHQLYNGANLPDGNLALCTRQGGLVILNKSGKLLDIINQSSGLTDQNVRAVWVSKDNILWLALDNGISQVNWHHAPLRFWDETAGLQGTIRAITTFQQKVYIATSLGVFCLTGNQFLQLKGINTESWSLLNYTLGNTQKLLVGTNDGIFEIRNQQAILIKNTDKKAVLTLYHSRFQSNKIFVGMKGGLFAMEFDGINWRETLNFSAIQDEIYSLCEDQNQDLWFGTFIQGVARIAYKNPQQVKRFTQKEGLPSLRDNRIYWWKDKVLIATQSGLFEWNSSSDLIQKTGLFGNSFRNSNQDIYELVADQEHNLWMASHNTQKHPIGASMRQKNGSYRWVDVPLRRLPEFSEPVLYPDTLGAIWIGGSDGLFKYDRQVPPRETTPFYTLIREVKLGEDSIIFHGTNYEQNLASTSQKSSKIRQIATNQPENLIPTFNFDEKFALEFQFTAPFFDNEAANEYSHFLEGYDQGYLNEDQKKQNVRWSVWSKDTKVQYTNLSEGNYTFYVKARNVYGEESLLASYKFKILPPWYRTAWAYISYTLLAILFIIVTIRVYTGRLVRQKIRLEETVAKRTEEIRHKNDVLEQQQKEILKQADDLQKTNETIRLQKALIERKNEDITASINYASRIQKVMLPRLEAIQRSFPDSFVMLKPRDIVSGDFYWFAETPMEPRFVKDPNIKNGTVSVFRGFAEGKKIISAIDCTGHGIPGAFMSMMGDAYLDQIINSEGITQAHLILKELNYYIRTALKQDESENVDGMDMALCVVNYNNATLEYAGAKNPIIYVQDGEAHLIRGDKHGIGGFQFEEGEKEYTRHVIPIDRPTSFYLFSDGVEDQFGGEKGKKFSSKRILDIFLQNHQKPMQEQCLILEEMLTDWMQGYDQVDDILVIGIHLDPNNFEGFSF
jgi:serine phosphatase RsbU (regulator of sigma subunit)/ligand-binding sensor domain-containing protein